VLPPFPKIWKLMPAEFLFSVANDVLPLPVKSKQGLAGVWAVTVNDVQNAESTNK
jgi:hypothetical protein